MSAQQLSFLHGWLNDYNGQDANFHLSITYFVCFKKRFCNWWRPPWLKHLTLVHCCYVMLNRKFSCVPCHDPLQHHRTSLFPMVVQSLLCVYICIHGAWLMCGDGLEQRSTYSAVKHGSLLPILTKQMSIELLSNLDYTYVGTPSAGIRVFLYILYLRSIRWLLCAIVGHNGLWA